MGLLDRREHQALRHGLRSHGLGVLPLKAKDSSSSRLLTLAAAVLVWPIGFLTLRGLAAHPDITERWYSGRLYIGIRTAQRAVAGVLPFSLSELLLLGLSVWFGRLAFIALGRWRVGEVRALELARDGSRRLVLWAGVLWAAFLLLWGFQHARRPYAWHAGLKVRKVSEQQLVDLTAWLVDECNRLRLETSTEALLLKPGPGGVDARILEGYERLAQEVPALAGGDPLMRKPILSPLLSRMGISGIYSPFTGEAHVNGQMPVWLLPFTACHELAHQKGFAREDEANFIAWQVCRASGDRAVSYSGCFVALGHALGAVAPSEAARLFELVNEEVRSDMIATREFWSEKRSVLTTLSHGVNDAYLKSSGSADGARSYGRMLDLMVAEMGRVNPAFSGSHGR